MFKKYTYLLQQWIPVILFVGCYMYVGGAGIKFPYLWEQSNKSLIPRANTDMVALDYINYRTIITPRDLRTFFPH
jgi:hypothetical protein